MFSTNINFCLHFESFFFRCLFCGVKHFKWNKRKKIATQIHDFCSKIKWNHSMFFFIYFPTSKKDFFSLPIRFKYLDKFITFEKDEFIQNDFYSHNFILCFILRVSYQIQIIFYLHFFFLCFSGIFAMHNNVTIHFSFIQTNFNNIF